MLKDIFGLCVEHVGIACATQQLEIPVKHFLFKETFI